MVASILTLSSCAEDFAEAASGISTKDIAATENDDSYIITVISTLGEPLQNLCEDLMKDDSSPAGDKVDNFEISTRSKLLSLVQTLLGANTSDNLALIQESIEDVLQFIRGVIDCCVCLTKKPNLGINSAQLRKLPFLLLEDAVDTLPTSLVQIIWRYGAASWLETILCKHGSPFFHQGSRYCLIRMCNKLLKNLSVSAQDEAAHFAGEISMILASVFPLSERSAVNVLGAFHVDAKYQVEYETVDEWMAGSGGHTGQPDASSVSGNGKGTKVALNYGFYSKFWGIQKLLTDPRKLLPKNANPQWNQNIDIFVMDVRDVLGTFEGYQFNEDLVKHLKTRWNAIKRSKLDKPSQIEAMAQVVDESGVVNGDVEMEENESENGSVASTKRQYKYLTSSQLLHLQLQDPEIRVHFLSQLFIISAFISKSLSDFSLTVTGATPVNKMSCEKAQSSLHQLEKRAEDLMKMVPPNGELHFRTLQWILSERESSWRHWKSNKCMPSIEKFASNKADKEDDIAAKRRKLMGSTALNDKIENKTVKANSATYVYKIDLLQDLPKISQGMSEHGNGMNRFFEEYADALDPEAGIEEEYHPKNNKLSSWRALRMLSRKHIGHFGDVDGYSMIQKNNGDFEGIVRKIWKEEKGQDIPGDMPKAEEMSDDEEDKDDASETSVKDESEDNCVINKNVMDVDDAAGAEKDDGGEAVDEVIDKNTMEVDDAAGAAMDKGEDGVQEAVQEDVKAVNDEDDDDDTGEINESGHVPSSKSENEEFGEGNGAVGKESDGALLDVKENLKEESNNRKRKRNEVKEEDDNPDSKIQTRVKKSSKEAAAKQSKSTKDIEESEKEINRDIDSIPELALQSTKPSKSNMDAKDTKVGEKKKDESMELASNSRVKEDSPTEKTVKKLSDSSRGRQGTSRKEQNKFSSAKVQQDATVSKSNKDGQQNGNEDNKDGTTALASTSAHDKNDAARGVTTEKEAPTANRGRGKLSGNHNRGNSAHGRQPEPRSQNNQAPQRRMDNRRKENAQSPQPPQQQHPPQQQRREQVLDNRGGPGAHTRFFSPDAVRTARDDRGPPRQQGPHGGPPGGQHGGPPGGQRHSNDNSRPQSHNERRGGRGNSNMDRRGGNDNGRGGGGNDNGRSGGGNDNSRGGGNSRRQGSRR